MRNTRSSLFSILGLAAAIGGVVGTQNNHAAPRPRLSTRRYRQGRPGKYPEQSTRQAMRAYRRAQGGPGIVLNTETHEYEARA